MNTRTRALERLPLRLVAACLLLTACWSAGASQALIDHVPLPNGAVLHLIGRNIVQNGRSVSIATLAVKAGVDETIDWYRERWPGRGEAGGHVVVETEGWTIVSHLQEGSNIAIQLKPAGRGGAFGYLSVMPLADEAAAIAVGVLPPGGGVAFPKRGRSTRVAWRTHGC